MNYYFKALKQYFDFDGRAHRKEYWLFFIVNFSLSYSLGFLALQYGRGILPFVYLFYLLMLFIPSVAVGVRRMHDVGKSGWFLLIPIYNLILLLTKGEQTENRFGPVPVEI